MKWSFLNSCPAILILFLIFFSVLSERDMVAKILFYSFWKLTNMPLILINTLWICLMRLTAYLMIYFFPNSVLLLKSYLSDRQQQIKISSIVSSWAKISKDVPQGSILGPPLFNIFFINDIFCFIKTGTL